MTIKEKSPGLRKSELAKQISSFLMWDRCTSGMRENAANLRDGVAKEMTREQIAEAQRLAREWAEKHRK